MKADVLTKALGKKRFEEHRDGMGMVSIAGSTGGSVGG